ncbi:MAG TPA: outer membrane lipoprotein carrier protein LolA [Thermoanaerobaculia bacterium]|nr:outer membrane lipoprotein carrier protein LolA [Thermoanaerobaculia bacterium]
MTRPPFRLPTTPVGLPVGLLAGLLVVALPLGAAPVHDDSNPWSLFDRVRAELQGKSPLSARFVQTFVPAGFSQGETEEGRLSISLPRCLRWDYGEPFPKSFLLCDDTAFYWNPGETSGHRYPIEDEEAPGLDFFLLSSADLRLRYNATSERLGTGLYHVALEPIRPTDDVVALEVVIDPDSDRIVELSYQDSEANRTRFVLTDFEQGAAPGTFAPPAGMTWEDP